MNDYIDYSNPELEAKIESIIGDGYGAFKPLIIDALLRRKFAFELTDDQSLEEAQRVKDNIETITFGDIPRSYHAEGLAMWLEKRLMLKNPYGHETVLKNDKDKENLYYIFQHELAHMLSAHNKDDNRNQPSIEIQEYNLNHIAAIKCMGTIETGPNGEDLFFGAGSNESYIQTATGLMNDGASAERLDHGYSDLTFLSLVEAPALGVPMADVVYGGIRSREFFDKVVLSRFNNDLSFLVDLEAIYKRIDYNMRSLHQLSYSNEPRFQNMSPEERTSIATQSVCSIMSSNFQIANSQILYDKRPITDDYVNELITRFERMTGYEERIFNGLFAVGNKVDQEFYYNDTKRDRDAVINKIFGVYVVNSIKDRLDGPQELAMLSSLAKQGNIYHCENYLREKFGVDLETVRKKSFTEYVKNGQIKDCQYQRDVYRKDFHSGKKWPLAKTIELMNVFMERVNDEYHKGDNARVQEHDVGSIMLKYIGMPENYSMSVTDDRYIFLAQKMRIPAQIVKQSYDDILVSQDQLIFQSNSQIYNRDNNETTNYNPELIGKSVIDYYAYCGSFLEKYLNVIGQNTSIEQLQQTQKGLKEFLKDFHSALSQVENLQLCKDQNPNNKGLFDLTKRKVDRIENVTQAIEALQYLNKRYGYIPEQSTIGLALNGNLFNRGDEFYKSCGIDFREVQKDLLAGKLVDIQNNNYPRRNIFQKFIDSFRSMFNKQPRLEAGHEIGVVSKELSAKYGPRTEQKDFIKRLQSYEPQPEEQHKETTKTVEQEQTQTKNSKEPEL